MIGTSIAVDEALLVLKILFLVGLYLFIWRIVRSAGADVSTSQESMIITPGQQVGLGLETKSVSARLVIVKSPALAQGSRLTVDAQLTIGRGGQNEVQLDGDEYASAQHARFEARRDGLWLEDVGSTNGTFVNGARVTTPRKLADGDVVRVGQTDLRVEL